MSEEKVLKLIEKIEEWQEEMSCFELDMMSRETIVVMLEIVRLKDELKETAQTVKNCYRCAKSPVLCGGRTMDVKNCELFTGVDK